MSRSLNSMCAWTPQKLCIFIQKTQKPWILPIHIPFQVLSKCRRGNMWKDIDLRGKGNPVSPHSLLIWNEWTTENTEKHRHDGPGCRNHLIDYNSVFSPKICFCGSVHLLSSCRTLGKRLLPTLCSLGSENLRVRKEEYSGLSLGSEQIWT